MKRWKFVHPRIIGFSLAMRSCWRAIRLARITARILARNAFSDVLDGRVSNFPLNFRMLHPKKLNPSSICVILVFSSDRVRPRSWRNCRMSGFTCSSSSSGLSPVTMKSSAYRVKLTFGLYIRPFLYLRTNLSFSKGSNPSSVMLQSTVEIVPPCGVPSSELWKIPPSTKPLFRNFQRISLSIGILSSSHSWLIWSKHPLMSPSKIQAGDVPRLRLVKQCSMASCTQRPLRNPYE